MMIHIMWSLISSGVSLVIINFAYHGITINANNADKLFSDVVSFNIVQTWTSILLYILMIDNITVIQTIVFICSVVVLGWVGFAFDYYSGEYKLIKHYMLFSNLSTVFYVFSILMLLLNTPIQQNALYFLIVNVVAFYGINSWFDSSVSKKIMLKYP